MLKPFRDLLILDSRPKSAPRFLWCGKPARGLGGASRHAPLATLAPRAAEARADGRKPLRPWRWPSGRAITS